MNAAERAVGGPRRASQRHTLLLHPRVPRARRLRWTWRAASSSCTAAASCTWTSSPPTSCSTGKGGFVAGTAAVVAGPPQQLLVQPPALPDSSTACFASFLLPLSLPSRYSRAKIADLGLAAIVQQERSSVAGGTLGTLNWAAPEMLTGQRCSTKADIFSFGEGCGKEGIIAWLGLFFAWLLQRIRRCIRRRSNLTLSPVPTLPSLQASSCTKCVRGPCPCAAACAPCSRPPTARRRSQR